MGQNDDLRQPLQPTPGLVPPPMPQIDRGVARGPLEGIESALVYQELQVLEQFFPACEKQNKYSVGAGSLHLTGNNDNPPHDEVFRQAPMIMKAQEHSECICRFCAGRFREFDMTLTPPNSHHPVRIHRPWVPCPCCCSSMMTIADNSGRQLGEVEFDCRCAEMCCLGQTWFNIRGPDGVVHHSVKHQNPNCCTGCRNCCAPGPCNEVWEDDIVDPSGTVVGHIKNVFAGITFRGCCSDASNLVVEFPRDADEIQRTNLLSSLILFDYLYWEKRRDNRN